MPNVPEIPFPKTGARFPSPTVFRPERLPIRKNLPSAPIFSVVQEPGETGGADQSGPDAERRAKRTFGAVASQEAPPVKRGGKEPAGPFPFLPPVESDIIGL